MQSTIGLMMLGVAWGAPVDDWLDAVVLVRQGSTTCAGVRIAPSGEVATAYHCVASGGRPGVMSRDGTWRIGRVSSTDPGHDLALVTVEASSEPLPWRPVTPTTPDVGDTVWALGHPLGSDPPGGFLLGTLRWSATSGIVSAVGPHSLQFDAPVNPGNSGGPVLDASGSVVGIVSRRTSGRGLAFAGRSDALLVLLGGGGTGMGPLGGTVGAELMLVSVDSVDGALSVGGRGLVAIRDRVWLGVSGSVPLSPRWRATRFGRSRAVVADGRLGLRQRVGRGSFAMRTDLWASASVVSTVTSGASPADLTRRLDLLPMAGLTLRMRGVSFELGLAWPQDGAIPLSTSGVGLGWPGVFTVF